MQYDYDQRKAMILDYAHSHTEFSAAQMAQDKNVPSKNAKVYLLRYHRQGLLSRRIQQGTYRYTLTQKGEERLQYFSETMPEFDTLTTQTL